MIRTIEIKIDTLIEKAIEQYKYIKETSSKEYEVIRKEVTF